jgi:hypothetical protein
VLPCDQIEALRAVTRSDTHARSGRPPAFGPQVHALRGKPLASEPRGRAMGRQPSPNRPDPVALLEEQAASRVPELVPIRYGRMLVSPFTFFRGAALLMAPTWRTPAVRHRGPALRGRAPVELRRVRVARTPDAVRHQRLRRDAPRTVGVGRQAAGRELRGRGA